MAEYMELKLINCEMSEEEEPLVKQEKERDFFKAIGSNGAWQRITLLILSLFSFFDGWQNFAITFFAPNVEFWCVSSSLLDIHNQSLPRYTDEHVATIATEFYDVIDVGKCEMTVNRLTINGNGVTIFNKSTATTVPCTRWEYDRTYYTDTLVSEWNLVCDRAWLISLAKSMYMIGFMVSVILFGHVSDSIGRYPTILICYLVAVVSGVISIFSNGYLMFVILRFFQALGRAGLYTTGFVLIMEIAGPEWRMEYYILHGLGGTIGLLLLPVIAWIVRDTFSLQVMIAIPLLPLFAGFWYLPESPRWLIMQGKKKEFKEIALEAAKRNGMNLDCDIDEILEFEFAKVKAQRTNETVSFIDLIKTPRMRWRTIKTASIWVIIAFTFYTIAYNTNDLGGDPYWVFFLSGLIDLPSCALFYAILKFFGRKTSLIITLTLSAVFCGMLAAVPPDIYWLSVTLAMAGKLCIGMAFGVVYLYTAEAFPTVVRNIAVGSCSTFGRVGSITAPFVRELGQATYTFVPNVLNAALTLFASVIMCFLPETVGLDLPDTMEEGESFGACDTNGMAYNEKLLKNDGKNNIKNKRTS